ncbi:MAG: hypothetical protein GX587_08650 [Bacteroidales bacterium]|nr:hypothetical protein [Bacteroidales bacterium]
MKNFLILCTIVFVSLLASSESILAQKKSNNVDPEIDVYYFHRTIRCMTCKKVEELATKTLQENFANETSKGTIRFTPVNVEEEINFELAEKISGGNNGLFLVKHLKTGDQIIDLNDAAYDNIRDEAKFKEAVSAKIREHLQK